MEKKVGEEWIEIAFKDLRKGDIFRMFEDDEKKEPCRGIKGETEFVAYSDPEEVNGILGIKIEP